MMMARYMAGLVNTSKYTGNTINMPRRATQLDCSAPAFGAFAGFAGAGSSGNHG